MSNSLLLSAKKGRHGCPGTMWGPASAKLHTHHHVLAAYCHYTQVASVLVMDVLFGTRWGLRAKTRWRSTCLPYWLLSQSPPQWCWESFPGAPSPVPGGCAHPCAGCLWRCPAGCAQTAQPCPQLWGGGEGWSCQHSMGPAPSSVSLSSLRVLREGFGFQAENRCVFNHR